MALKKSLFSALCMSALFLLPACSTTATPETQAQTGKQPSQSIKDKVAAVNADKKKAESPIDAALESAAKQAEASGNTQEMLAVYSQMTKIKPNDPIVAMKYARALRNDQQYSKAKSVLAPYTKGETAHPDALTELAMTELALGDFKGAENASRQAITITPENGRAFLALGTALDAQGFHEQAEISFRRGIEYWEGDPAPILNNLALNLASQGKLEQSLAVLQRAKAVSPHRIEIERNLRIISALMETAGPTAPAPAKKPSAPIEGPVKPQTASAPLPEQMKTEPKPVKVIEVKPVEAKAPKDVVPASAQQPIEQVPQKKGTVQRWKSGNN